MELHSTASMRPSTRELFSDAPAVDSPRLLVNLSSELIHGPHWIWVESALQSGWCLVCIKEHLFTSSQERDSNSTGVSVTHNLKDIPNIKVREIYS